MTEFKKGEWVRSTAAQSCPKVREAGPLQVTEVDADGWLRFLGVCDGAHTPDTFGRVDPVEPETEEVAILRSRDFQAGDVVVKASPRPSGGAVVTVRREKAPEPPKPVVPEPQFGTGYVDGHGRVRGFMAYHLSGPEGEVVSVFSAPFPGGGHTYISGGPAFETLDFTPDAPAGEVDERIDAWERVARHPALTAAYAGEGPLIDSVMVVLDRITNQPVPALPTREALAEAIRGNESNVRHTYAGDIGQLVQVNSSMAADRVLALLKEARP